MHRFVLLVAVCCLVVVACSNDTTDGSFMMAAAGGVAPPLLPGTDMQSIEAAPGTLPSGTASTTAPTTAGPTTTAPASTGPAPVAPSEMMPSEMVPTATMPAEMDPAEMDPTEMDPTEMDPTEMDPTEMDPAEMDPAEMDPAEMDPAEMQPGWATREDLGEGDGSDVVTIGDSWMYYAFSSGGISGALGRAGKRYPNYAVAGTLLTTRGGLGAPIPTQWPTASRRNPKTVIMTAGGNDVLLNPSRDMVTECRRETQVCTDLLATIGETLGELWGEMAEAGVQDVIYIGYSTDAGNAGPKSADLEYNGVQAICDAAPLNCHTIQATDIVMGQFGDGIHPTSRASDRLAAAILELMEERGMRR